MDLFEYQARDLFAKHDVPVLAGEVIDTPEAARAATERLGGKSVVKAQVKVGGRGKAGGVKLAANADEAVARATDILGMDIKGHTVHKVMIAETAPEILEEYYVSFLLDRANRTFLSIASVEGGMEIEEVAATRPEAVAKIAIDAIDGVDEAKAREIVEAAKFPAEVADKVANVLITLWDTFIKADALLVEATKVNPLVDDQGGALSRCLLLRACVASGDRRTCAARNIGPEQASSTGRNAQHDRPVFSSGTPYTSAITSSWWAWPWCPRCGGSRSS